MAQQVQGQFGYQTVQLIKTKPLGTGSYGAVYEAKCDDLPCAAKILHPTFFQFKDPGAMTVMRQFEQECNFLSAIRHPNIVQYLGSYRDPETQLPVLLMELMDESLTRFLERSQEPLPYHTQVDLCHDIALALAYLHSNDIIHRDLSSNNVLLIGAGYRAKVTDFGMAKLFDVNRSTLTPLTMCPGTLAYMSPEALDDPPVYTKKLDCFSFGALDIQIVTQQFPDPGPRAKKVRDPQSPVGKVQVPVPETERRKSHTDLISPTHPLLPIATACLSYNEEDRPSAQELCRRLAALKETPQYGESVRRAQETNTPAPSTTADREGGERQIRELQQENEKLQRQQEECDQQIRDLQQQLQVSDDEIQAIAAQQRRRSELEQVTQEKHHQFEQTIRDKDRELQEKDHVIKTRKRKIRELQREKELQQQQEERDRKIQDLQQLLQDCQAQAQEKDAVVVTVRQEMLRLRQELGQATQEKHRQIQQIQQKDRVIEARERQLREVSQHFKQNLPQREKAIPELQEEKQHLRLKSRASLTSNEELLQQPVAAQKGKLNLSWKVPKAAPRKMRRGSAAVHGSMAFFKPAGSLDSSQIQSYNSDTEEWSTLPKCPTSSFTLAVVNGLVTAVGGMQSGKTTNSLLCLVEENWKRKWVKHFPPMPTKRCLAAVVSSGKALVVAGGWREGDRLATVEVMDTDTLLWSTARSLPHPLSDSSATVCGDSVYLAGGIIQHGDSTKTVFACSLSALISSQIMEAKTSTPSTSADHQVWHAIADLPMGNSTCVALNGQLLAVGGCNSDKKRTNAILKYNTATHSWEVTSRIPTARFLCLVAVLSDNKLMVVGGSDGLSDTEKVEIATAE